LVVLRDLVSGSHDHNAMDALPALLVEPAPVGVDGDLSAFARAASFRGAGLPCHARVGLSGLSTHELATSHRKEGCCVY
jgi:hypothetical protein